MPPALNAFLNGRFLPAEEATVPLLDRGFLYGDGLFESIRIHRRHPLFLDRHLDRLQRGAQTLALPFPDPDFPVADVIRQLLDLNPVEDAVIRLSLSRGRGPRGYSPRGASQPTRAAVLFPTAPPDPQAPPVCSLHTARSVRVPIADPLAPCKHTSRILHVVARAEADAVGADDALLLNTQGNLAEATAANLFWFQGETCLTPPLLDGALDGVTRALVLLLGRDLGWTCLEASGTPADLTSAHGAFLTQSTRGILEVHAVDGVRLPRHPRLPDLHRAYLNLIQSQLSH